MGNVCTGVRRGETMGREIGNRDRKGLDDAPRGGFSHGHAWRGNRATCARNRVRTGDTPAKHTGAHGHIRGEFPPPLSPPFPRPPRPPVLGGCRGDKEDTTPPLGLCGGVRRENLARLPYPQVRRLGQFQKILNISICETQCNRSNDLRDLLAHNEGHPGPIGMDFQ